jgi:murein DD-endopeptidase MepM/ murein hydrolase activator NlpD
MLTGRHLRARSTGRTLAAVVALLVRLGGLGSLAGLVVVVAPSAQHPAEAQYVGDPPRLLPPVASPITDHFRAPSSPYGPGNRGLDYQPAPGTPVRTSATGSVEFAGSVAGALWVTVAHAHGYRTTYGPLFTVVVRLHQRMARGDALGTSGPALHLSLRQGDEYLDPEPLLDTGIRSRSGHAVLVPLGESAR